MDRPNGVSCRQEFEEHTELASSSMDLRVAFRLARLFVFTRGVKEGQGEEMNLPRLLVDIVRVVYDGHSANIPAIDFCLGQHLLAV